MEKLLEQLIVVLSVLLVLILYHSIAVRIRLKRLKNRERQNRELLEQINQAQKMESIGRLAGGVAHDFNNMLAGIKGAAEALDMKLNKDSPLHYYTEIITKACRKASNLTSQLLVFSRNKGVALEDMDFHVCVSESIAFLAHGLNKKIYIRKSLKATEYMVFGSHDLLLSMIMNLCFNAKDAMPNGGHISIKTRNIDLNEKLIASSTHKVDSGKYVELTIKDYGVGIPKDIQHKIFEPFFTTKEVGKGSGLGLPAVYGIVTEHNGTIRFESSSKGTTFKIYLPVIRVKKSKKTVKKDLKKINAKILIVDDEEILLSLLKDMLSSLGASVVSTSNPKEAVELYKKHGDFDLVMLDVIMPHRTGIELYEDLRKVNQEVRVLFVSGYSQDKSVYSIMKANKNADFIHKPYNIANLTNKISAMLGKK